MLCFGLHGLRRASETEIEFRDKFEFKNTILGKDRKCMYLSRNGNLIRVHSV